MSADKSQTPNQDAKAAAAEAKAAEPKELTAADVAKLVSRSVVVPPEKEGGKATEKQVAVKADEVLSFKDYGDYVVVVTKDGQKFTGNKAAK